MGGGGGGGTSDFDAVLFTHWRDDYTAIVQDLLATKLTQLVIDGELDRVLDVATAAFDADPYVTGTAAEAVESLKETAPARRVVFRHIWRGYGWPTLVACALADDRGLTYSCQTPYATAADAIALLHSV